MKRTLSLLLCLLLLVGFVPLREARATSYTVTFDSLGGSSVSPQTVEAGGTVNEPAKPTLAGWRFLYWYADVNRYDIYDFTRPVSSNMTLYADWAKDTNLICDSDQGKVGWDDGGEMQYSVGWSMSWYKYSMGPNPTYQISARANTGYKFKQWRKDSASGGVYSSDRNVTLDLGNEPSSSLTLYAEFEADSSSTGEYEIRLEIAPSDEAGTVTGAGLFAGDSSRTVTATPKEGYVFSKWQERTYETGSTEPIYKDVSTDASYTFTLNTDRDLIAVFSKVTPTYYTVTFVTDGGTAVPPQTVEEGKKVTRPPDPTQTDWRFSGWYRDAQRHEFYNFENQVSSHMTLYAKWACDLSLTAEGSDAGEVAVDVGSGFDYSTNCSAVAYKHEGKPSYSIDARPKAGYAFKEWRKDGPSGTLYSTDAMKTISIPFNALSLYAIFEKVPYKVTVTNDGNGTASASPISGVLGTEVTLTATPNPGYQFDKWEVVSGGVTVTDNKFTFGPDNVVVKALFEPIPVVSYTVTVTDDGNGTATASHDSGAEGKEITLTATPNEGYRFKEWNVVSGGVTVTDDKFNIGTSNVVIQAVFEPIPTYTFSFVSNGGSSVASQTVMEGKTATEPAYPTREGYLFAGWHTDAALTEGYDFSKPVLADTTVYAKWTALSTSYIVRFESNGGTAVSEQSVEKDDTVAKPADPTRDGYVFDGWFANSALTEAYDFSKPVTVNLTLFAKWTKEETTTPEPTSTPTPTPMPTPGTSATPVTTPTSGTPTTPAPTPTPTPVPTPTPEPSTVKRVQAKKSLKLTAPKIKKATYLWQYRTGKTGAWLSVRKGTKQKLSVKATMALDGYQYRCQVKSPAGTISYTDIYELYVYEPLKVRKQPKWGKICLPGTKRTISITAQGASSYQWVTRANGSSPWTKIEGATGASYVVDVQEGMNNRQYACEISGKAGTTRSKAAVVKIAPWPKVKITRQPQWKKPVASGSPVTLTVKALNAETYQWYYRTSKNGAWIIMGGETKTTVTFPAPANGNGYQYKCTAKGKGGTVDSKPVTLKVVTP